MTVYRQKPGIMIAVAIALALLPFLPNQAKAAGIGFRNELDKAVVVQGSSNINGMVTRGQPNLLAPGRTGLDPNLPPGPRQITIYDAGQPNRILLREVIAVPPTGNNLYFSIRPATVPGPYPIQLVPQGVGQ